MWANLECGSLLPLSARLLAGALGAGTKLPAPGLWPLTRQRFLQTIFLQKSRYSGI